MFDDLIAASSAKYAVPASLIAAVIQHESGGKPDAVGDNGLAHGLMQMHPTACETVGKDWSQMFDPAAAIDAGTAYLAWCCKHMGGDWKLALMAYNQGPTVMARGNAYAEDVLARWVGTAAGAAP